MPRRRRMSSARRPCRSPSMAPIIRLLKEQTMMEIECALARLRLEVAIGIYVKGYKVRRAAIRSIAKMLILKEQLSKELRQ